MDGEFMDLPTPEIAGTHLAQSTDLAQILRLIEAWQEAVKEKDVERAIAGYAEDLISFDLRLPLRSHGRESLRRRYERWFKSSDGPIVCRPSDLEIVSRDDLACAFCVTHVAFDAKGEKIDLWVRWTALFKKVLGDWKVSHEHVSIPVNTYTGQALWNLSPNAPLSH